MLVGWFGLLFCGCVVGVAAIDRVLEETHTLDGRSVEVKRAIPREKTAPGARLVTCRDACSRETRWLRGWLLCITTMYFYWKEVKQSRKEEGQEEREKERETHTQKEKRETDRDREASRRTRRRRTNPLNTIKWRLLAPFWPSRATLARSLCPALLRPLS